MTVERKRVDWIDIARGIAIICVIVGHSLGTYWPNFLAEFIFVFHMPIFFVLSGYLYRPKNSFTLTKSNIFNLLIPYITTVLIEVIVIIICRVLPNGILYSRIGSIKQLLVSGSYGIGIGTNFFGISIMSIGAIWFLLAMFFGSLIFNIVMKLNIKKYDLLVKAILSSVLTIIGIIMATKLVLPFSINSALGAQIFFFSGYLIKEKDLIKKVKIPVIILLTGIWIFAASVGIFGMVNMTSPNIYVSVLGGIAASVVVIKFSIYLDGFFKNRFGSWLKKVLVFFGANSLLMLCFHLIDLDSVNIWPRIVEISAAHLPYVVAIIIGIIYRIIFVLIATLIVSKTPVINSLYMNRKHPIKNIFKSIR